MNKRGQATVFIIIGIIVVIAIVLGIVFRSEIFGDVSEQVTYPGEIQEVVDYVQDCVDDSTKEALVGIGYSGGYYNLPEGSFFDEIALPYYLNAGENLMPSRSDIENELNSYVSFLVANCVDLSEYSEFTITTRELEVITSLGEMTYFAVAYPMDIAVGEKEYSVNEPYESTLDVNFDKVYEASQAIVRHDLELPEEVDLNYLLGLGMSSIKYAVLDDGTTVYILEDNTAFNGEESYTFMFASYFEVPEEYDNMTIEEYWGLFE